jgi:hypothetical protein
MLCTYFWVPGFGFRHSALGTWLFVQCKWKMDMLHTGFRVLCFCTQNSVICAVSEKWTCCVHIFGSQALGLGPRHLELDDLCNVNEKWTCCTPGFVFSVSALNTWWFVQWVKNGHVVYIFSALGLRASGFGTWHLELDDLCSDNLYIMIYHFASVKCCVEYRVPGFGTRYSVPGTRYLALGTQYSALGTRYSALSTQACNLIPNTTLNLQNCISCLQWQSCEFWMPSSEYWVPGFGTRYSVLGTRYSVLQTFATRTGNISTLANLSISITVTILQVLNVKFWISSSGLRYSALGTWHSVLGDLMCENYIFGAFLYRSIECWISNI